MTNMQKIKVGQFVKNTKTGQFGEVVSINKKRTNAKVEIKDLDAEGNILSTVTVTSPLVELKVVQEVEKLGEAIEKAVETTTETTKEVSDSYKSFAKKGLPKSLSLKQVVNFAKSIVEPMLQTLYLESDSNFLRNQKHFLDTIDDAIEKESKVDLLTDNKDRIVAQIDALTDTAYFINGTLVELAIEPIYDVVDKTLSTERYPLENRLFHQVKEFHKVGGHPAPEQVTEIKAERLVNRFGYTIEEVVELIRATSDTEEQFTDSVEDLKEKVRVYTRSMFKQKIEKVTAQKQAEHTNESLNLTLGLIKKGMNLSPNVFSDIVHNANMTKFYIDENGEYYAKIRESDGKIMKSPDFIAPEPQIIAKINELLGE